MTENEGILDQFERAREAIRNLPGFQHRQSTITAPGTAFFPGATWVVQTVITDEHQMILLEKIDRDGGTRIVIPDNVTRKIYQHYDGIRATRRSRRAERGAETRKKKGMVPFQKKDSSSQTEE